MDATVFIQLVINMRQSQNAYYRQGRKHSDLITSKALEKQVDQAILEGITFPIIGLDLAGDVRPTDEPKQNPLFE